MFLLANPAGILACLPNAMKFLSKIRNLLRFILSTAVLNLPASDFGLHAQDTPAANASGAKAPTLRKTVSLDGPWQIAEGKMDPAPAEYTRTVRVPGLVDMARPTFESPGPKVAVRDRYPQKDPKRDAFWYLRSFTMPDKLPPVAILKVAKAMYGTKVWMNGVAVGDHAPCFTPGYFDVRNALKPGSNEVVIRIGADRDAVGPATPSGFDREKSRYIPGIFDSVELILSGAPRIDSVQVAPDLLRKEARIRVGLKEVAAAGDVSVNIREAGSGKVVASATAHSTDAPEQVLDMALPIPECHLWSPEDPFLYLASVRTAGDEVTARFGMREFKLDPATKHALLNGRTYFMRGTNFTTYRFFEDSERGDLPWNEDWVRLLFKRAKEMHWNSVRFSIGFPPESWYRIADEEGMLVQDEFPIWEGSKKLHDYPSDELVREYTEWMRERWNHPCVVIWDASNETISEATGPAVKQVRGLDLSSRPWDNSYMPPAEPGDSLELHPYHFYKPTFKLSDLAKADRIPKEAQEISKDGNRVGAGHAIVINEYGWLWLTRDGAPTTLTKTLYSNLLGDSASVARLRHTCALYTAAETEFWRAYRAAAAVMHFNALGYSRSDGQTSDNWLPGGVAALEWEPEFFHAVRDAFAPVGVMIEYWEPSAKAGSTIKLPVILINDPGRPWTGAVTVRIRKADTAVFETSQQARIEPFGTAKAVFDLKWPAQDGACILEAEISGEDGKPVHSVREVMIGSQNPRR